MNLKKNAPILTPTDVLKLIEDFRNAEMCRDADLMRAAIEPVWNDFDKLPDFANFQNSVRAELLRNTGVFLSFYGQAHALCDYQSKGKDLLTCAIEVFQTERLFDRAAEARVMLAFCYWNTGEIEECEALLEMVEVEFSEDIRHPVYLKICINHLLTLIWKKELDLAEQTIQKIEGFVEYCSDLRLQAMFHNEAGICFRSKGDYEKAAFHYREAISAAQNLGNRQFVAINYNNLSFLYKEIKNYEEAIHSVNRAIEEIIKLGNQGYLAHFLDTKALIYLDTEHFDSALDVIKQAIKVFREGEDAAGLTDALWTQVRCLLRLERKEEVLIIFNELLDIARTRIGETAVQKFTRALADEIYILRDLPLTDEVQQFKKERVGAALVQAKGKISKAASLLGFKSHQSLSNILNNQFPTLYQELGFRRRVRRKQQNGDGESRTISVSSENILNEAEISQLALPDKNFAFDFPCSAGEFKTFYFDRFMMKKFGIESGAVIAVVPIAKFKAGMLLLISDDDDFTLSKTEYDSWAKVFYIMDERGEPLPLDAEQVVGEPVGYCLIEDADNKFIEFSRLLL